VLLALYTVCPQIIQCAHKKKIKPENFQHNFS